MYIIPSTSVYLPPGRVRAPQKAGRLIYIYQYVCRYPSVYMYIIPSTSG